MSLVDCQENTNQFGKVCEESDMETNSFRYMGLVQFKFRIIRLRQILFTNNALPTVRPDLKGKIINLKSENYKLMPLFHRHLDSALH